MLDEKRRRHSERFEREAESHASRSHLPWSKREEGIGGDTASWRLPIPVEGMLAVYLDRWYEVVLGPGGSEVVLIKCMMYGWLPGVSERGDVYAGGIEDFDDVHEAMATAERRFMEALPSAAD